MGYRSVKTAEQIWYILKHKLEAWLEWQDAKSWAKQIHPAWVEIATKSGSEEAREHYKNMILAAYRGDEYV